MKKLVLFAALLCPVMASAEFFDGNRLLSIMQGYCIVYETNSGEVVFEGHTIRPADLFNILTEVNGIAEYVKYYQLTDEEMENWEDHIYK